MFLVQNDRNAFERCARSGANIIKDSNGLHNHPTLIRGYDAILTDGLYGLKNWLQSECIVPQAFCYDVT